MLTTMNLFGSIIPNLNTTFLIDTSGSMYSCLTTVREHLLTYLRVHAVDKPNQRQTLLFNLIEFNSDIRRWADRSVFWSHASVAVADEWLCSLVPKTGTNTLGGLLTAFSDPLCQQVVLVTDGIPDQEPKLILHFLQQKQHEKRPCHIFYVNTPSNTEHEQEVTVKFLQDLASFTFGSLTIAHFSRTGTLEHLAPMINYQIENTNKPLLLVDASASMPPVGSLIEPTVCSQTGKLLIGQECLARKNDDGYYYRGKILNQMNTNQFMVEFGPRATSGFNQSDFQSTYIFDIIHYADALMHKIQVGDFVLAPDGQHGRFVPGEVLDGFEKRASCANDKTAPLVVHFSNGRTARVRRLQEAIWIPPCLYERIKFELTLPPNARDFLQEHSVAYPTVPMPGYPMSKTSPPAADAWPFFISNHKQAISPTILLPQQTAPASVNSHDVNNLVMPFQENSRGLMTSDELNRKVDQQIEQNRCMLGELEQSIQSSSSSCSLSCLRSPRSHSHSNQCCHRHSCSTSSSPILLGSKKKNVCFNEAPMVRRYSVDDLDLNRQSIALKSCLKTAANQETRAKSSPNGISRYAQTQTPATPSTDSQTEDVYRPSLLPNSIECWHTRQLKSAPISSKVKSQPATKHSMHRPNLQFLYEKAQQEVRHELQQRRIQHEEFKRQQTNEQSQLLKSRQKQEIEKAERKLEVKRQFHSQIMQQTQERTRVVEDRAQRKLLFKQHQYAQRSAERTQMLCTNDQKANGKHHRRHFDNNEQYHIPSNDTLIQEQKRLYNEVILRRFCPTIGETV